MIALRLIFASLWVVVGLVMLWAAYTSFVAPDPALVRSRGIPASVEASPTVIPTPEMFAPSPQAKYVRVADHEVTLMRWYYPTPYDAMWPNFPTGHQ